MLTVEGGQSRLDGVLIAAGTGRINLLDHRRPWARANLNAPRWNVAASYTGETSNGMRDLGSGAPSYLDTYRVALEGQWHGRDLPI